MTPVRCLAIWAAAAITAGAMGQSGKIHASLDAAWEAQPRVKAWVFFADKGLPNAAERGAAIATLSSEMPSRTLERRMTRGTAPVNSLVTVRDLPVAERYLAAVRATGAEVHQTSRWLNAASVWCTRAEGAQIATLECVTKMQPVARAARRLPGPPPAGVKHDEPVDAPLRHGRTSFDYGRSFTQLDQIGVVELHEAGYTGAGVIIGILDTGFNRNHVAFNQPLHAVNVLAEWDFVNNDPNTAYEPGDPFSQHNHGTLILGCIGAYAPGEFVGGAPDAAFVLAKTEDTADEYPAEEDNYVAGLEWLELQGVDVTTASLGYDDWYTQADFDGLTAVTTIAVNILTSHGVHHCNSAGNNYHDSNPATSSLVAPADGFDVITCGAVTKSGVIASFSSEGPTADGRLKPEVLACGSSTDTVSPDSNSAYTTASGTSLSTPLVAAAVACLVQARPDWTVAEMRAALFSTASDQLANGQPDPLFVRGYGIINAIAPLQDCNGNGTPDVVDIADGSALDCQGDGVPDSCQIADATSADCNDNGIPDECDTALPEPVMVDDAAPVHGWIDIASTGAPLGLTDDGEAEITIPFTNEVVTSTSIQIGNNGGVGIGGVPDLTFINEPLPSAACFGGARALLPMWDDLDSDTGDVYWQVVGDAPHRTLVVQWQDRPHYPGDDALNGNEVTFQVQLFESPIGGVFVQMLYEDVNFGDPAINGGGSASIGMQRDADFGLQWSFETPGAVSPSVVLSLQSDGAPNSPDDNNNGIPDECELPPADITGDGVVGAEDLNLLLGAWNACAGEGEFLEAADLDGNGCIGAGDLNLMLSNWG